MSFDSLLLAVSQFTVFYKTWTEKSNQAKAAGKEAATGKEATMAAAS